MSVYAEQGYTLVKLFFQRGLGLTYLIAFLVAANQFRGLIGEDGLLPFTEIVDRSSFKDTPSLFHLFPSDQAMKIAAWAGVLLSLLTVTGISEAFGTVASMAVWFLLWALYLSFVNVGRTFYGFGWESLLLETGFLAVFLGGAGTAAPEIVVWLVRWVLFRVMFGAGLIKIRGDRCWRDLTCMHHHYETQPMPNPFSWFFDKLPGWVHKFSVAFNHFAELIVPFLYFAPQPYAAIAGGITIMFQLWLMLSGNFSWLNFLTIVLATSTFSDAILSLLLPLSPLNVTPISTPHQTVSWLLLAAVVVMSYWPVKNMLSPRQAMNFSFNNLHLVNTYGAFGSITKTRREVVVEGTTVVDPDEGDWEAYSFKGKPTATDRLPLQWAPYHLRLDWQMWFAAMSKHYMHPWFSELVAKLLENDEDVTALLKDSPFKDEEPTYIRATLYRYEFTSWKEWRKTGDWWKREKIGEYFPVTSKGDLPLTRSRGTIRFLR